MNSTNQQISPSTQSADKMQSVSHTLHLGPMDKLASNAMRTVLTGVGFDNNGARLVLCYQTTL